MKNPKWHRDEIILALDLYFKLKHGDINANNPEVIKLSIILNQLNLPVDTQDIAKYRNPNGVSLKLSNFLAIDPDYKGKGMDNYSKLDEEIFFEYLKEKDRLLKEVMNVLKKSLKSC
jgi:5-methylcytosine-specific restriction enzyme A